MIWRVEIKDKEDVFDATGEGITKDICDLGFKTVKDVRVINVFILEGDITEDNIKDICENLLVDPITQHYSYTSRLKAVSRAIKGLREIEIAYNPGVMDPAEESTLKGIRDLGISSVSSVRMAKKYLIQGSVTLRQLNVIIEKVLSNKLIQHVAGPSHCAVHLSGISSSKRNVELITVDLLKAGDRRLKHISRKGQLFLNLEEMKAVQKHFKKLRRNPTDCELETIAQTWSEHCHHKTFRGVIRYRCYDGGKIKTKIIRSLLKSTIVKATQDINKDWCVSVFHDNSGVIEFDDRFNVCFKVETHNHPSALEPFGGANTGIGGVIRDSLGTGLGAKPICNTDVFCFAPPEMSFGELPQGTLHPKRIMKGVVGGVRDYGNKMGIPTVNGAILFDKHFAGNPLIYCGTVGIIPRGKETKAARQGDLIVVIGGKTGRDGIHGATFSSGELTHESEVISSGAVQIGNPIQEKKVLDAMLQARDQNLYTCVTDCGAGGLSSAVGEMGQTLGCRVDMEKVPLKYQGLSYTEIWISESQERMVLSVPSGKLDALLEICRRENVEVSVIGEFTGTKRLELFFCGKKVCDLDMEFLHEGIPAITREAMWRNPRIRDPRLVCPRDLTEDLKNILAHGNVCSKEWVIRQYDHEVQGASVVKPLVGVHCDGPSDASVIRPRLDGKKGVIVSNGINVRFGMIDPFWMAASCIDEAIRQIIAVGGDVEKIAILDNFCWGNPDKPDRLGALVRAAEGCYRTAVGYRTPFISGKDSLYNEYTVNGKSLPIPGTLLISAIGIMEDVNNALTMDVKVPGNLLYIIGETKDELGGSIYYDTKNVLGTKVPRADTKKGLKIFRALFGATSRRLIVSLHDCSEGGLAVCLAEMAFSGGWGIDVSLKDVPYRGVQRNDTVLFSESNSRFVAEITPEHQKKFETAMKGISLACIGRVERHKEMVVSGLDGNICIRSSLDGLKEAWQKTLRW